MIFTKWLNQKAWAIRKRAALKYGVDVLDIDWGECLKWANEMTRCIVQLFIKTTLQRLRVETPKGEMMEMECKSVTGRDGMTRRICKLSKVVGKRRKTVHHKVLSQWDIIDFAEYLLIAETERDTNQTTLF